MNQPTLFDLPAANIVAPEDFVLYALGEFQARKKELVGRALPLDRLKGAFRRAAEVLRTNEPPDDALAEELKKLGARVVRVEQFVAKHPFRITVNQDLAARALDFYRKHIEQAGVV